MCFCFTIQFPQAAREHTAHSLFQTRPGKVRQRLSCNGEYFFPGSACDFIVQVLLFAFQRLPSLVSSGVGRRSSFVE